MKQIDNFYTQKNKNMNLSLDSSRTADSISYFDNSDTVPLKTEIEIEEKKISNILHQIMKIILLILK